MVLSTATLSKRVLRDVSFVVSRECGKLGLAVPSGAVSSDKRAKRAMALITEPNAADEALHGEDSSDSAEAMHDQREADKERLEVTLSAKGTDYVVIVHGYPRFMWPICINTFASNATFQAMTKSTSPPAPAEGRGTKGGVLSQGVPNAISHEFILTEASAQSSHFHCPL